MHFLQERLQSMAVGKKSIQRAAGSIRETQSVKRAKIESELMEERIEFSDQKLKADADLVHENKFRVISSIKSELPDYLL